MPRQMRLEYAGAIYRVMSRGEAAAGQRVRAEGITVAQLKRGRWKEADLSRRAKSDPGKLALAARLRRETTLTIEEMADRLQMGSRQSVGRISVFSRDRIGSQDVRTLRGVRRPVRVAYFSRQTGNLNLRSPHCGFQCGERKL